MEEEIVTDVQQAVASVAVDSVKSGKKSNLVIVGVGAGVALTAYAIYKLTKFIRSKRASKKIG